MHKMLNVNDYFQVLMRSGRMHSECGGPGLDAKRPQRMFKLGEGLDDGVVRAAAALAGLPFQRHESLPKDVKGLHVDRDPRRADGSGKWDV